jgi:hypothetical protein
VIRAWHLNSGFLVDRGSRTSQNHPLTGAPPEGFWRELREYVQLDAQGKVTKEFKVSTWCIDDESSVSAYAVIEGELRERTLRTFYSDSRPDLETETAVLTGLSEIEDLKTLAILEKALATEKQQIDDHAARLRREGEERVAAIPGSTTDPGLGADYLRAQKVLRDRVRSYDEALYIELLRTLGRFGSGPALDLYVAACRHAAFDPTVNRKKKRTTKPVATRRHSAELRKALGALQRQLLDEAEGQDQADAPQNAAAYRKAADLVDKAAKLLDAS